MSAWCLSGSTYAKTGIMHLYASCTYAFDTASQVFPAQDVITKDLKPGPHPSFLAGAASMRAVCNFSDVSVSVHMRNPAHSRLTIALPCFNKTMVVY